MWMAVLKHMPNSQFTERTILSKALWEHMHGIWNYTKYRVSWGTLTKARVYGPRRHWNVCCCIYFPQSKNSEMFDSPAVQACRQIFGVLVSERRTLDCQKTIEINFSLPDNEKDSDSFYLKQSVPVASGPLWSPVFQIHTGWCGPYYRVKGAWWLGKLGNWLTFF